MRVKIGDFLKPVRNSIMVQPDVEYKQVTIRMNNQGVCLRGIKKGIDIKTKKQFLVEPGQFILSKIDARNGAFGLVPEDLAGAIVTQDFPTYSINHQIIDKDYLVLMSSSGIFLDLMRQSSSGTTNRKRLKEEKFLNIEIELPDKSEQTVLTKKAKNVREIIDSLKRKFESQEKILNLVYHVFELQFFLGNQICIDSNNSNFRKVELPPKWEWKRFIDVAKLDSNLVDPRKYPTAIHIAPDNIEKKTGKLLSYKTVAEDGIQSPNHLFHAGHILYSKIRPALSKVIIADFEGLCSADMYPITSLINKEYLFFYMLSSLFLKQSVAHDTRVAMPKINKQKLGEIFVPVPPNDYQNTEVKKLKEIYFLISYCKKVINKQIETINLIYESVIHKSSI